MQLEQISYINKYCKNLPNENNVMFFAFSNIALFNEMSDNPLSKQGL